MSTAPRPAQPPTASRQIQAPSASRQAQAPDARRNHPTASTGSPATTTPAPPSGSAALTDAPPPAASARFPDAPPTAGRPGAGFRRGDAPAERRPATSDDASPAASARFPDASPTAGRPGAGFRRGDAPAVADAPPAVAPYRPGTTGSAWSPFSRARMPEAAPRHEEPAPGRVAAVTGAPPAWTPAAPVRHPDFAPSGARTAADPRPPGPDPALSWSAPPAPGGSTRPHVSFARPEGVGEAGRGDGGRGRVVAAAVSMVLGLGLVVGAATGSWLAGDAAGAGERSAYTAAAGLWHSVPVDQLFPPTVTGRGAGPGGADRTWTRIAVAPDGGCADAFDPLLRQVLAPVGCSRLLRATYTDATQSYVTTVGLLFTTADPAAMRALDTRFDKEGLARRTDLLPRPYAAPGTAAAGFGDRQRASWTVSVLTDAPVVVYAVSGWADGRTVAVPQPAAEAAATGATTAPAQAGLGNEAKGLADRVERGLRTTAASPSERPS
ncbi:hypothetical protein OHA09_28735 [Streptomyces longwoodensis]|uniref:hypothetical protein n=1 Tax=Streptomyces longwoodensis TaxID=68231 RepID=UPI002E804FA6|nr:hypothetical protein [Streptomyces longwoodensis]WUC60795.1 hypothetical protein OHA09_28735 [Streptomyces longwoodensis]